MVSIYFNLSIWGSRKNKISRLSPFSWSKWSDRFLVQKSLTPVFMKTGPQALDEDGEASLPIHFSHCDFPPNAETFKSLGMPLGCTITPFTINNNYDLGPQSSRHHAMKIARCEQCHAYLNSYCKYNASRWLCCLCKTPNSFSRTQVHTVNLINSSVD
jgi:hypothetical protein